MYRVLSALAAFGLLVISAPAQAENDANAWDGGYQNRSLRRSDFTLGVSSGFGLGNASGYPNEVEKIDDPDFRSTTKLAPGSAFLVWLGVAFNDYLTFGFGAAAYGLEANDRKAKAGGFIFHLDAYPLFGVAPALRDLAFFTNLGLGVLTIEGAKEKADGGVMSLVQGGVAYERFRLWRIAIGPSLSVLHSWSESAQLTSVLFGARASFYGGP